MAGKKVKLTASTDCKLRELGARIKRAMEMQGDKKNERGEGGRGRAR